MWFIRHKMTQLDLRPARPVLIPSKIKRDTRVIFIFFCNINSKIFYIRDQVQLADYYNRINPDRVIGNQCEAESFVSH